jgi:putative ABC transport system ATP-binding protein
VRREDAGVLFELDHVAAERGGRRVLEDISLRVGEGVTAVAGPSGSGKSTLLRLLNRLADPVSGTVRYRGRDVRQLDVLALRREVALMPQLPALLPGTVEDNVRFPALLARREADLAACLQLAGLPSELSGRDASELSVGQQQRVMLARALVLEPRVLFDEDTRAHVERTLVELHERLGTSFVLVTHDAGQARRLGQHQVRLRDGRIERHDTAARP